MGNPARGVSARPMPTAKDSTTFRRLGRGVSAAASRPRRLGRGTTPSATSERRSAPARLARIGREEWTIDLNAMLQPYLGAAVVGLAILLLILFGALFAQSRRVGSLDRRLRRMTQGDDGRSIEGVLEAHLERVQEVTRQVDALSARAAVLEADARRAFTRVGFVRFNPFDDTGGNQSFALAILDSREDGVVMSSLHSRASTRMYAKAMSAGRSEGALSQEEEQAVEQARSESLGRKALSERVGEDRSSADR